MFVYELNLCWFESCCNHLNLRDCFEQEILWGWLNYWLKIHPKQVAWHVAWYVAWYVAWHVAWYVAWYVAWLKHTVNALFTRLAKWLSVRLKAKWLWVRVCLLSLDIRCFVPFIPITRKLGPNKSEQIG